MRDDPVISDAPRGLDAAGGFRTRRLRAERLTQAHQPDLQAMHGEPLQMATLGGVRDDGWTMAYLERNLAHWEAHGFGLWMLRLIEHGDTGPVVGRGLLRHLDVEGVDEVEIGYSFWPAYWGRGLATEIAAACLSVGHQVFGCMTMVAVTLPSNAASRRVLEKAGLSYERDIQHGGERHVLYRIRL